MHQLIAHKKYIYLAQKKNSVTWRCVRLLRLMNILLVGCSALRPELLKSALVKAVEKGHLEQITGKGANGTFQVKLCVTTGTGPCRPTAATDWLKRFWPDTLFMSQLKRTGNQVLLKGSNLEDAITTAITAMNEPKTCSTTILRRYLVDTNKDRKEYQLSKTPPLSYKSWLDRCWLKTFLL